MTTIQSLDENASEVVAIFNNGAKESFALVCGADGVHSRVRELTFGPESQFDRFLGYYVAAFHLEDHHYSVDDSLAIYEEPNRSVWIYSLGERRLAAVYIFRHEKHGARPSAAAGTPIERNLSEFGMDSRENPQ